MFLTFSLKDRSGITHLSNVSDYPSDPHKKSETFPIYADR